MSSTPPMEENARLCIDEIRSIPGIVACALISSEGVILGKYFREGGLPANLFAVMCATVFASAEAACGSVHAQNPSSVTVTATDAIILIVSAGESTLITAVTDKLTDLPTLQRRLSEMAVRIREEA